MVDNFVLIALLADPIIEVVAALFAFFDIVVL